MPYEDYMTRFRDTEICCNPDPTKYWHSAEEHHHIRDPHPSNIQFYKFNVAEEFELTESSIGLHVYQMGDVLA